MHIVVIAWLYVTFVMALAMPGVLAGGTFFALVGIAPTLVAAAYAARRQRRSVRQRDVDGRDDADTEPDQ